MRSWVRPVLFPAIAVAVLIPLGLGTLRASRAEKGVADPVMGQILLAYGVGGVLTKDGMLWTYRPDQGKWLTVDQAFAEQERTTHVLPLPVAAASITQMQSFGFLVTKTGTCWLYDLEKDVWKEIGAPPGTR